MKPIAANRKVLELAGNNHAEVARILGYKDRRNVWSWTKLGKPFPPYHCRTLEVHFNGKVTCQQLRPHDWAKHWPDLVNSGGRPSKQKAEAA